MAKLADTKTAWIRKEVTNLKKNGLFVHIPTIQSAIGAHVRVDGKNVINLCSNNYLGFANHPRLIRAAKEAIETYGIGPTAVRTIAGTTDLHLELEKELAKFKRVEAVITLQSGFVANLATIPVLSGEGDIIFSDELNHASIIDACRLSKAVVIRYEHANPKDLEDKIKKALRASLLKHASKNLVKNLIVTDGVFSMDGDIAPLPNLVGVAKRYGCLLMVDDAHGEGVLGKNGRGIVDFFNLHGEVDIEVGTMSKALGVVGGYVAGRKVIIDYLRQRARPFLFSSSMTFPDVAASLEAVKILQGSDALVKKLWGNTVYFKEAMKKLGFNIGKSKTPIVPVMLGDVKLAQEFSKRLFAEGVFAKAIGYPTVPIGAARIRVMNSATHSKDDLDKAQRAFEKVGKSLGAIS